MYKKTVLVPPNPDPDVGRDRSSQPLHLVFQSTHQAIRKAISSTLSGLQHFNLSTEEKGTIELVLAEVMNNIVEHAYAGASDGTIELRVCACPTGLQCLILDDGRPMPDGKTPLTPRPDLNCAVDDLPEGGFGWFLIDQLAKDVEYSNEHGRNHLGFRLVIDTLR